jgi:hypothetical protein
MSFLLLQAPHGVDFSHPFHLCTPFVRGHATTRIPGARRRCRRQKRNPVSVVATPRTGRAATAVEIAVGAGRRVEAVCRRRAEATATASAVAVLLLCPRAGVGTGRLDWTCRARRAAEGASEPVVVVPATVLRRSGEVQLKPAGGRLPSVGGGACKRDRLVITIYNSAGR